MLTIHDTITGALRPDARPSSSLRSIDAPRFEVSGASRGVHEIPLSDANARCMVTDNSARTPPIRRRHAASTVLETFHRSADEKVRNSSVLIRRF